MDFSKPKVIIDSAEYDYLLARIQDQPETTSEVQNNVINMHEILMGSVAQVLPAYMMLELQEMLTKASFSGYLVVDAQGIPAFKITPGSDMLRSVVKEDVQTLRTDPVYEEGATH